MKKVKDIINDDWNIYTYEEMKEAAVRVQAEANKRFSVQSGQTYKSPAVRQAEASGGRFNITKQENINKMRKEFARAVRYLKDETSTQKGFKEAKKRIITAIKEQRGVNIKQKHFDKLFDVMEELRQSDPISENVRYKYEIMDTLTHTITGNQSFGELYKVAKERLDELYKQAKERNKRFEQGISAFFE